MENLNAVIEVKGRNFKNGQAFSAFEADAKIVKENVNRVHQNDEDTVNIKASDCGKPQIEASYHSKSNGVGEVRTTVEIDAKGKAFDAVKGAVVDAFEADSKLVKVDAGCSTDKVVEDWFTVKAGKDCEANCASAESFYTTKTSDVVS